MSNAYVESEMRDRLAALRAENERLAAEVARLTTIVDLVAAIKAEYDQAALGWSGKESDRHWSDLFDALNAYRAATTGGSDATT